MLDLRINGQSLELRKQGSEIKYTMQIADIFNIASFHASYTNSFSIPKTPNNIKIFEFLGIAGDTSTIPYNKIPATLTSQGFPIIKSGWLQVKSSEEEYKISIVDGIIDFFKAIENKTLGVDLDLSVFDHDKNLSTVFSSFDNDDYKYIVADYNGKNEGTVEEETGINIDYLVPCFSVKKLWDIIFETFDYTYNESSIPFINGLYVTYPKPPIESFEPELVAQASKGSFNSSTFADWNGLKYSPGNEFWDDVDLGEFSNNWQYVIPENGTYVFTATTESYGRYGGWRQPFTNNGVPIGDPVWFETPQPIRLILMVNGEIEINISTSPSNEVQLITTPLPLIAGDVVQVRIAGNPTFEFSNEYFPLIEIRHNSTTFEVSQYTLGEVSLQNAFKEFQIKDFIKEILWRTGLTPIIDQDEKHLDFIKLSDRLNFSNAIDWSDKYVKRTKELYTQGDYAQQNSFQLKHNNPDDMRGDGYLQVNNRNLPDKKTLVTSKIYAPELDGFVFHNYTGTIELRSDVFRIWDREASVNANDEVEVKYKGLSNRFYFLRYENKTGSYRLLSEVLQTSGMTSDIPFVSISETMFDELVFSNYKDFEGVLFNFRAHDIEVALSLTDILSIDMTKPYYFKQEGQYYMLNRLAFQEGQNSTGEFIRINKL